MKRWLGVSLAALSLGGSARAEEPPISLAAPPTQLGARYSRYEQDSIDRALAHLGASVDPSPEGKIIEDEQTITLDVFEKRDFIPNFALGFVNWFHVTSRPYVIEREILIGKGARWDQAMVDETARNLRNLRQLSVVLCIPLRGSSAEKVKLLLITKDVWSLRLNQDYLVAGGKLQYLLLQPSEENFLGTHQKLLFTFVLDPATYSVGGRYIIPRIAGSRIQLDVEANAILSRETGEVEGSRGGFAYGQPLYSTQAKWAWSASMTWQNDLRRRFVGGELGTYDAPSTSAKDGIPYEYREDILRGRYEVVRSFGARMKHDFLLGVGASRNVFRPLPELAAFAPSAQRDFVTKAMPVSDTQIGPFVQYHTYSNRHATVLDFNTLGLQEDFTVGHDAYLRLTPISTALGSSRSFLGLYASFIYTVPLGDGLARAFIDTYADLTTHGVPQGSVELGLRLATPRTPAGRLHFDARVLHRYANYLNTQSYLGGGTRPRGYATNAFSGKDMVAATLEFRSRAVQILGCALGAAAFLDTGDAFDGFAAMRLKQSAGVGLRVVFPQVNRTVLRVDWGFPFTTCAGDCGPGSEGLPRRSFPGDVAFTFQQAFGMPVLPAKSTLSAND